MTELGIHGVSKAFGRTAVLRDVSMTVAEGSLTAVLGASGSGKTTLLRIVAGFERPDAGRVELGGRTGDGGGQHVRTERRGIGYVPQEGALFPHLDVAANVAFGLPRRERKSARIGELLDLVGLLGMQARFPHQLSGGQQQRVALARALAVSPGLVLLDEPFSSLDAALRASVRGDVHAVLRRSGVTAVLVTHDQDEALSMADDIAVLRDGRMVQQGSPRDLYRSPVDAELATFLGESTLAPATLDASVAVTAFGSLPLRDRGKKLSGAGTALLRPEQIEVVPGHVDGGLQGTVRRSEYYGHDAVVHVGTDAPGLDDVLARVTGQDPPPVGAEVTMRVQGDVTAWTV